MDDKLVCSHHRRDQEGGKLLGEKKQTLSNRFVVRSWSIY